MANRGRAAGPRTRDCGTRTCWSAFRGAGVEWQGTSAGVGMTDIPMTYEPPVVDPAEDLVLTVTRTNSTDEEDCWVQAESPVPRHLVNLKGVRALVVTGKTIPEPRQRTIRLGRTTEPGARPRSVGAEWLPRPAVLRAGDLAGLVGSKDLRSQDPITHPRTPRDGYMG